MQCNCNTKQTSYIIELNNDECIKIERLYFELAGATEMVKNFTSKTRFPVDKTKYNQLLDKYLDISVKYNKTLNDHILNDIDKHYNTNLRETNPPKVVEIRVDFRESVIKYTIEE